MLEKAEGRIGAQAQQPLLRFLILPMTLPMPGPTDARTLFLGITVFGDEGELEGDENSTCP